MGGFSQAAGLLAEGAGQFAKTISEHLGAVSHVFEHSDEGKMLLEDAKNIYQPTLKQSIEVQTKAALDTAKADPLKPKIDMGKIHGNAQKVAREAWLGPKDSFGATLVASIEKKHGIAHAQSVSNGIAFLLKDYVDPLASSDPEKMGGKIAHGTPFSSFKRNVRSAGVALTSEEPSYTPVGATANTLGKYERPVTAAIYQTFSPLMVVPHIATIVNGLFGSDPATFLKGIAEPIAKSLSGTSIDAQIDNYQKLLTTGAFTESNYRAIQEWNQFEATGHPPIAGGGAARLAYKLFHQPGFAKWRDYNLLSGVNVGKATAEQLGKDLAKKGLTPRLQWQASQFGLDPHKLISQGGILDEGDLSKAVFRFVNEHYFLDNSLSRSSLLQSSWWGRILGTYHGYVTRQSKLMAKAMFQDWSTRGPASVVKNLAVGMAIMPLFGEGIKIVQQGYRGQDALGTAENDIKSISGQKGAKAAAMTYMEAMGHVGAYGVYGHVVRGSLTHSLLQSAAGPMLSAASDLTEDTASAINKTVKSKGRHLQRNFKPVERDLAFDTPGISLLAQFLGHRVLPNSKDKPKKDPARELYHWMRGEDANGNPLDNSNNQK